MRISNTFIWVLGCISFCFRNWAFNCAYPVLSRTWSTLLIDWKFRSDCRQADGSVLKWGLMLFQSEARGAYKVDVVFLSVQHGCSQKSPSLCQLPFDIGHYLIIHRVFFVMDRKQFPIWRLMMRRPEQWRSRSITGLTYNWFPPNLHAALHVWNNPCDHPLRFNGYQEYQHLFFDFLIQFKLTVR